MEREEVRRGTCYVKRPERDLQDHSCQINRWIPTPTHVDENLIP